MHENLMEYLSGDFSSTEIYYIFKYFLIYSVKLNTDSKLILWTFLKNRLILNG